MVLILMEIVRRIATYTPERGDTFVKIPESLMKKLRKSLQEVGNEG